MQKRTEFHNQIMSLLEGKTDSERSKLPLLHNRWHVTRECKINEIYLYKGELYRCRQTHNPQPDWKPDLAPALFSKLMFRDGIRIIPEVITTGDMFAKDELGWWGDTLKKSKLDANVWTPEQYPDGWEDVEV